MKKILYSGILFFFLTLTAIHAQEISYGFKAGLNFSSLEGDSEIGSGDNELESHALATGFHVGGAVNFKIVDRFGARVELLFSQKGTEYVYEGPSFQNYVASGNNMEFFTVGNRKLVLDVNNSYLDVPLMVYTRLGKIELSGGVNFAVLVGSVASGEDAYTITDISGNEVTTIITPLDYNYINDEAGFPEDAEVRNIEIGNRMITLPASEGAYFNYETRDGNYFNIFDIGLNGGISFFINRGLYLGGRVNYGLLDATNNDYDFSRQTPGANNTRIARSDKDQNLSYQISLGFSF